MGLAVCVGVLADYVKNDEEAAEWLRQDLQRVNALLEANGVEPFHEPESLPVVENRCPINGYPYLFLHYLRRVAAIRANDPAFVAEPLGEGSEPDSPWVDVEIQKCSNHIICHSDAAGYYVPRPFDMVLVDEDDTEIAGGGIVGSSQKLQADLIAVAPALGITLKGAVLSDAEASRITDIIESQANLWIEHLVWLDLFEASRLSIEHGTAIVFA